MSIARVLLIAAILFVLGGLALAQNPDSGKTAPVPKTMTSHNTDTTKAAGAQTEPASLATPDPDTIFSPEDYVIVETHHRIYANFLQVDTVKFHQRFQLGDENLFAEVIKFVADLKVTMKGEKIKMSDTLNNPAVQIRVVSVDSANNKDSLVQESWAFFYSGAPHFSRAAFFAFTLKDFKVSNPKYIKPPDRK